MTRNIIALIGLALLVGCGGGGGDSATPSASVPTAQPDMLVATSDGLWRGQANGQGGVVFNRPNLHQLAFPGEVSLGGDDLYYPRESPPIISDYPNRDIWSVHTDGTGDHAVLNTTADERVRGANDAAAIYEQTRTPWRTGLSAASLGVSETGLPTRRSPSGNGLHATDSCMGAERSLRTTGKSSRPMWMGAALPRMPPCKSRSR